MVVELEFQNFELVVEPLKLGIYFEFLQVGFFQSLLKELELAAVLVKRVLRFEYFEMFQLAFLLMLLMEFQKLQESLLPLWEVSYLEKVLFVQYFELE